MASVTTKFAIVRSIQTTSLEKVTENNFFLNSTDEGLIDALRKARKENDKAKMIKLAQAYVKSVKFIDSSKKIEKKLIEFIDVVNNKNAKNYNQFVRENFQKIFSITAVKYIDNPVYKSTFKGVSESLIAAAIDNSVSTKTKSLLVNLTKALQVINLIIKDTPITKEKYSFIKIILPSDIFPLPLVNTNLKEHRKQQAETKNKVIENKQKKNIELSNELKSYNLAIDEILKTFDNSNLEDDETSPIVPKKKGGFYMPKKGVQKISTETKNVIKKVGLSIDEIDVARTVSSIERQASETSQKMYADVNSSRRMAKIGNNEVMIVDDDVFEMGNSLTRIPGSCPTSTSTIENDDSAPITTNGKPDVRVLGFADLMMVEQELARYELGEIAHIENVLKSEFKDRKYRITNTTEDSLTTESEEIEAKENELTSSERFELQTEAQKVINESTSMDAGVTVSASYGFVDATANFNYSTSDSSTDSQRTASNFARETISKAVNKIETRSLERRFRKTVNETEEINQHTFDNKSGTENISGAYRFVDKIYNAQVVNYGKRFMLEFIVPEPAAFLRYVMTSKPVETNFSKPDEPGYCSGFGRKFSPLQVQDIDRNNYLFWASKYGVEDVTPPPTQTIVVSTSISSSLKEMDQVIETDKDKEYVNTKNISINIPEGYSPANADILIDANLRYADEQDDTSYIHLLIDKNNIKTNGLNKFIFSSGVWKNVAVAVNTLNKVSYAAVVNIYCRLTKEGEQKWQLETFNSIMNAYKDQLRQYNNEVESAKIRDGFTEIKGVNPLINRETEKVELKKGCISLLSGQQFEGFDAMNRNVGLNGYPEIDFDDAAEEGKIISFFEQAFEWNNMTYVFYPYFWANKKQWLQLSQLKDTDPLFTKFLQAGSCRVNIPVRTGFEISILNYLNSFSSQGEGMLINSIDGEPDSFSVSIVEELKSQMNNMNTVGIGKINVTKNSSSVTGIDTSFSVDDENKRIIIAGKTYVIKQVDSSTTIQLKTAYTGDTQTGIGYSFGAKLIGESWEVRLPTNLVKIDDNLIF